MDVREVAVMGLERSPTPTGAHTTETFIWDITRGCNSFGTDRGATIG